MILTVVASVVAGDKSYKQALMFEVVKWIDVMGRVPAEDGVRGRLLHLGQERPRAGHGADGDASLCGGGRGGEEGLTIASGVRDAVVENLIWRIASRKGKRLLDAIANVGRDTAGRHT